MLVLLRESSMKSNILVKKISSIFTKKLKKISNRLGYHVYILISFTLTQYWGLSKFRFVLCFWFKLRYGESYPEQDIDQTNGQATEADQVKAPEFKVNLNLLNNVFKNTLKVQKFDMTNITQFPYEVDNIP